MIGIVRTERGENMTDEIIIGREYIVKVTDDGECVTVGELVRCKDCKHWTVTSEDDYQSCECDALIRHKDFYCARAERKGNDNT